MHNYINSYCLLIQMKSHMLCNRFTNYTVALFISEVNRKLAFSSRKYMHYSWGRVKTFVCHFIGGQKNTARAV